VIATPRAAAASRAAGSTSQPLTSRPAAAVGAEHPGQCGGDQPVVLRPGLDPVDGGAVGPVHLDPLGLQAVAGAAGGEELGVHVLRDGHRAVTVAHRRVDDVEQRHRGPAVRGADGVQQAGLHGHRRAGVAGADLLQRDAQMGRERVGRQAREQLGWDVVLLVRHDRTL
jgi:hypothetical protein